MSSNENIKKYVFDENWVRVVSRMTHPMSITYMGEQLIIPPRGRSEPLKKQGLGALPTGLMLVPAKD